MNTISEIAANIFHAVDASTSYLDKDNILWKKAKDQWIGKRSVYTHDLVAKWLEEVEDESEVRSWWCGKDSDYNEVFR